MCCMDNEKYLWQCRRNVYDIISDVDMTSNELNQQIKEDAYTTALKNAIN